MQIGKRFGHGIRIGVAAAVFMALAPPGSAQDGGAMVEWPSFGNGPDNTKYSAPVADANEAVKPGQFKPIPIMRDGVVYVATEVAQAAAIDAATGETLWSYDPESWRAGRPANIGFDEELGTVYLPVSTPTNNFYGGHRLGDNLFAESIVCLDADTGERVWHFQAVHHGLWDYDFSTPPQLVDITVDGREIKALAQVSKQGFTYVLDRETGEAVWPIEERPVPESDVPGERASPTQPFPTKPAPFDRQGVSEDDLIDLTPELLAEAKKIAAGFHMGPLFTPPSTGAGTLMLPSAGGGANWPGATVDPETGVLYVPSSTTISVHPLAKPDPARSNLDYVGSFFANAGGPRGLPLVKPPWTSRRKRWGR